MNSHSDFAHVPSPIDKGLPPHGFRDPLWRAGFAEFHRIILQWFRQHGRGLPWRKTRNSYKILLSEVMLQQTQVSRVREKYPVFLGRFPTIDRLARAKTSSVLRAWQGMGYNNRAVRLHRLARIVAKEKGGRLPSSTQDLQKLPGVGRYTAHAIACFAFNQSVPVVDTNIARVLSRLFPSRRDDLWSLASNFLPAGRAYEWNQALMDLGATVCTTSPKCGSCPLSVKCPSAFTVRRPLVTKARLEPGRNGTPNRIYRGRVIDILRNLAGTRSISAKKVGERIKSDYRKRDGVWLFRLLEGLEEDGLVTLRRTSSDTFVSFAE